MCNKKYHYFYKITNLKPICDKKFYIGVRSSNVKPKDDNYWGSSKTLKEDIDKLGVNNFKKNILKVFDNRTDANNFEIFLHEKYSVHKNENFYNKVKQKSSYFSTEGGIYILDDEGNNIFLTSEEYKKQKKYKYHSYRKINVINGEGKIINVNVDDPKYLNGEYKNITKNMISAIDENNNRYYVTKDEYYNYKNLKTNNTNKVVVKDNTGNNFLVDKNDERYLNGELVSVHKNFVLCKNVKTGDNLYVNYKEYKSNNDLVGINKGKINGDKNPNAKTIHIYNNKNKLMFVCNGNFKKTCQENNLPFISLKRSYMNNGKKIYDSKRGITTAKNKGNEKFIGWYAKEV